MKIKSIKLHNFMRYKGDNELRFSTDTEKNVTVILGDNTFGKTTVAQAFRWGLYETFNDTSYTKKKDIVLLNNEVIADMKATTSTEYVSVEIVIENDGEEIKYIRRAYFKKKSDNLSDMTVRQVGETMLTMQICEDGIWGDVISNDGSNSSKQYVRGCVQESIENMFPESLSNYFFFDGERWNDLKSKTEDIKSSVDTILGISGLMEMKNHLKDKPRNNVKSLLRGKLKGTSGEYERLQADIISLENFISHNSELLNEKRLSIDTIQRTIDSTEKTLNDNRKIEEDQKECARIEQDINQYKRFQNEYYADIVKLLSNSSKYFAAQLLPELTNLLNQVDLEGKDIPGITVDTIDYLVEHDECICGTKFSQNRNAYDYIIKLKKLVPPEMLGGAAGKLQKMLEEWKRDTSSLVEDITNKAENFEIATSTLDDKIDAKERLESRMDRKTNLGPVRIQNKQAKDNLRKFQIEISRLEIKIDEAKKAKLQKEQELDNVAKYDEINAKIYRALEYVEAIYNKVSIIADGRKKNILADLNKIIGENFQQMFNDKEKYAKLEEDYKIHVYYHKVGNITNYEEEHLSNGETIAINFVFIVSILELAKKYKEIEKENAEYGMENAILGLPLVLDGPFSALSNENTSLIAKRLPQFAEQVIIFMLDKDWEASGLNDYTLPEYCYRVIKEINSNSSMLENN